MTEIIDEANETCEDPYSKPDKDEEVPSLRQEETSQKPIHRRMAVSKQKRRLQVYVNPRAEHDSLIFKNDSLRKRYDIRNIDPKKINNIFMRTHVEELKKRTEEGKITEGLKQTFEERPKV